MGEGQRLSAQSRKDGQPRRTQFLNGNLPLAVPQLAEIEVNVVAVAILPARPAKKHVAGGLDQSLPPHGETVLNFLTSASDYNFSRILCHSQVVEYPTYITR